MDSSIHHLIHREQYKRFLREEIVLSSGSTSKVGKNYVGQMICFVMGHWKPDELARQCSPSLRKALLALQQFNPQFPKNN